MRMVVKIGTSTLAHTTGRLNIQRMEKLCKVLSDLKNAGHEIILVSSGAIGMGVGKLSLTERPKDMPTKQAAAAVGQGELMYIYDKLFTEYNHIVAQMLIDYPILQGEDNLSYINTDVYGSFALAGSIFLDSRCDNTFHDARIWRVTVSVSYDDNGRLTAVPTIRENESAPKADGIVFNNSYDPTFGFKELTVKKVWDDDGYKSRPTSVKIQLLHNGRVYDTVTLNACNEWTYTWPRLLFDGDNTWEINESPKPHRYRVSYTSNFTNDYETYYVTVTNTYRPGSLIQTGQLNWPIFVLGGIGIALVVIGVVRYKRGKDDNA